MVEEGIDLELDSLNELIETYKESLNSAKNLYDYQKKISSQTSEIASLQKQLLAYSGDTSEENRARLQKLQVSLAEAEDNLAESQYDQYIKDQTELLDASTAKLSPLSTSRFVHRLERGIILRIMLIIVISKLEIHIGKEIMLSQ